MLGVAGLLPAVLPSGSVRADDGFSSGPAPEWVRIQPVPAAWPSESSANGGANWRIWLLDAQVDRRGGEAVAFYEQVAEARTRELVGELARFSIPFNPEFQSLTIHDVEVRRDGEWVTRFDPQRVTLARREAAFEADIATGVMSALIVVDDVRPGDLVRYRDSVRGENPVLAGMLHDEFRMTWHDPILRRHVRVLFPRGAEVDVRPFGIEAEPVVRSKRDGTEVVLLLENAPVVKVAGDLPAWYDAYASVQIGPRRNWSEVVAWALPLYPEGQPLPDELEQRIAQWRSLPDAHSRATAALEAVQDEVRYFSVLLGESSHRPSAPSQTWLRRFGDCKDKAWLLAVLLRRLDVDAVPALVSSGGNRRIAEGIPAASQFDHAIVRARIDDQYLLAGTDADVAAWHTVGPLGLRLWRRPSGRRRRRCAGGGQWRRDGDLGAEGPGTLRAVRRRHAHRVDGGHRAFRPHGRAHPARTRAAGGGGAGQRLCQPLPPPLRRTGGAVPAAGRTR